MPPSPPNWPALILLWIAIGIVSWLVARLLAGKPRLLSFLLVSGFGTLFVLFSLSVPTYMGGIQPSRDGGMQLSAHTLAVYLSTYARDHEDAYPPAKSSTEVFQKLLDEGYLMDPGVLYLHMPGKRKGKPGERLRPENVCWDVSQSANGNISNNLPLVFPTGYQVVYVPGARAVPRISPYPLYGDREVPSSWDRYHGWPMPNIVMGVAVGYGNTHAIFLKLAQASNGDWFVPDFVPADFDPEGHVYQQLTPEGILGN